MEDNDIGGQGPTPGCSATMTTKMVIATKTVYRNGASSATLPGYGFPIKRYILMHPSEKPGPRKYLEKSIQNQQNIGAPPAKK